MTDRLVKLQTAKVLNFITNTNGIKSILNSKEISAGLIVAQAFEKSEIDFELWDYLLQLLVSLLIDEKELGN